MMHPSVMVGKVTIPRLYQGTLVLQSARPVLLRAMDNKVLLVLVEMFVLRYVSLVRGKGGGLRARV
jgi:hypothetical protein